ncbi:ATP synthase-coupling factor 6, mitochondrial-like [Pipistrellus kuhlii]|uniref:ATP synthase-coupling factor 6, mitochondrial-like n=1 Tax=Pipistrellus kuhlii TaxID=59472 RepID=UPI001E26F8A4|nr:ATP synthase-coupling factor 6, mitochondrial-like [Pipistrellus kuhlii]
MNSFTRKQSGGRWHWRWPWQLGMSVSDRVGGILQRLFPLSSASQSAVSAHLRRNAGVTAVTFDKKLDPVQKLFVDKVRGHRTKRQSAGEPAGTGPEHQRVEKQMYGMADMTVFPDFRLEDPKLEDIEKPHA